MLTKPKTENWKKELEENFLREKLADIEHQRWADWQKYLHSVCVEESNGDLTIPAKSVKHWERQIATDYKDLTEKEKDSDREQVDRYFYLIQKTRTEAKTEERQKLRGIIDKEIERIEEEPLSKIRDSVNSGRISGLYFIRKKLTKKIK